MAGREGSQADGTERTPRAPAAMGVGRLGFPRRLVCLLALTWLSALDTLGSLGFDTIEALHVLTGISLWMAFLCRSSGWDEDFSHQHRFGF